MSERDVEGDSLFFLWGSTAHIFLLSPAVDQEKPKDKTKNRFGSCLGVTLLFFGEERNYQTQGFKGLLWRAEST